MMTSCRVKKAVVRVTELSAALVPIHGLLTFLTDVNGLRDPPGGTAGSLSITIDFAQSITGF